MWSLPLYRCKWSNIGNIDEGAISLELKDVIERWHLSHRSILSPLTTYIDSNEDNTI